MKKWRIYSIWLIFILLSALVVSWMIQIKNETMPPFDLWSRPYVDTVADTTIYTIFRWITEFGSFHVVFPLTIVVVILFWITFRDYLPAFIFGLGVLSAHLMNSLLKDFIARERPSVSALLNAEGYSYPSGHSMVTIVCYGLIAYLISTKLSSPKKARLVQLFFGTLVLLIGFSRYILNVHYLTDIVSGFLFGGIILIIFIKIHKKIVQLRIEKNTIKS